MMFCRKKNSNCCYFASLQVQTMPCEGFVSWCKIQALFFSVYVLSVEYLSIMEFCSKWESSILSLVNCMLAICGLQSFIMLVDKSGSIWYSIRYELCTTTDKRKVENKLKSLIAREIRKKMYDKLGFTLSAGMPTSKLVDGIYIIRIQLKYTIQIQFCISLHQTH